MFFQDLSVTEWLGVVFADSVATSFRTLVGDVKFLDIDDAGCFVVYFATDEELTNNSVGDISLGDTMMPDGESEVFSIKDGELESGNCTFVAFIPVKKELDGFKFINEPNSVLCPESNELVYVREKLTPKDVGTLEEERLELRSLSTACG